MKPKEVRKLNDEEITVEIERLRRKQFEMRTQSVTERKADIVGLHDFAHVFEVTVQKAFFMVRNAPFGHDGAASGYDTRNTINRHGNERQEHPSVNGEIVHALFGLLDQCVSKYFPIEVFGHSAHFF